MNKCTVCLQWDRVMLMWFCFSSSLIVFDNQSLSETHLLLLLCTWLCWLLLMQRTGKLNEFFIMLLTLHRCVSQKLVNSINRFKLLPAKFQSNVIPKKSAQFAEAYFHTPVKCSLLDALSLFVDQFQKHQAFVVSDWFQPDVTMVNLAS